jgi:hypothetical protein
MIISQEKVGFFNLFPYKSCEKPSHIVFIRIKKRADCIRGKTVVKTTKKCNFQDFPVFKTVISLNSAHQHFILITINYD